MIPPLRSRSMSESSCPGAKARIYPASSSPSPFSTPRRSPSPLCLSVSLSLGSLFPPRGGRTGAGSDTANRRTATDNDAAKCASVVPRPSLPRWSTRADKLSGYPRERTNERVNERSNRSQRSGNPREETSTFWRVHVPTLPRMLLAFHPSRFSVSVPQSMISLDFFRMPQ